MLSQLIHFSCLTFQALIQVFLRPLFVVSFCCNAYELDVSKLIALVIFHENICSFLASS